MVLTVIHGSVSRRDADATFGRRWPVCICLVTRCLAHIIDLDSQILMFSQPILNLGAANEDKLPAPAFSTVATIALLGSKGAGFVQALHIKISAEHNVISITTNGFITNSTPVQISVHLRSPDYT